MADSRFFENVGPLTLKAIIDISGAQNEKDIDCDRLIQDVAPLNLAGPNDLSFMDNLSYKDSFISSKAGFCFLTKKFETFIPNSMVPLFCDNPYRSYGVVASKFYNFDLLTKEHSLEFNIHPSASIEKNSHVSLGTVIGKNVEIGKNTFIGTNSNISEGVIIGNNCKIHANVTLSYCIIGDNVEIFPGTCIGQDGFGFVPDEKGHIKIPQLGRVLIGNDVQIGSNTTIDRGSGPDTVLGNGCRIDNLVHIAHNVKLGKGCIVAGQVGIAGSTSIGDYVMLAGQSGVSGHLKIGSGSKFAVRSGVISDVSQGQTYGGFPAVPIRDWHRQSIALRDIVKKRGTSEDD